MIGEPQYLAGRMLTVGIQRDHGIEALASQSLKPRHESRAFASIGRMTNDFGPCTLGKACGAVS